MSRPERNTPGDPRDGWLTERRRLGQDGRDEVYHVVPHAHRSHGRLSLRLGIARAGRAAERGLVPTGDFTLGTEQEYRIPDTGCTSTDLAEATLYVPSVEVVVEFESPGDETWVELPFYVARGVREVWVVTPSTSTVQVLTAPDVVAAGSAVLGVSAVEVAGLLGWG